MLGLEIGFVGQCEVREQGQFFKKFDFSDTPPLTLGARVGPLQSTKWIQLPLSPSFKG